MFILLSGSQLTELVKNQVNRFMAERQPFTSHLVTTELRERNADIFIKRAEVYAAVFELTKTLMADGKLTRQTRDYGMRPAYTYITVDEDSVEDMSENVRLVLSKIFDVPLARFLTS